MTAAIASTTSDHTAHPGRSWPRNGRGDYCGSGIERSRLLGDLVVASSPGWVRYAVAEACAGRVRAAWSTGSRRWAGPRGGWRR